MSSPFRFVEEKTCKLCRTHNHELPENRPRHSSIRHFFGLGMLIEDMQLAGYSARTQEAYVAAVRQLFEHLQCTPAQLTEEQLRQYFLYLSNDRTVSRPTATIALCGIKFFFERTLKRDWTAFELIRPRREKKLPVVLSREEVHRILNEVHTPVYRTCLKTILQLRVASAGRRSPSGPRH